VCVCLCWAAAANLTFTHLSSFRRFVNATRAGDMSAEELGEEGELGPVLELVKTLGFKGFLGAVMVADTICVNLIERSIFRKLLGGD
jgi:hypothetical protein